MRSRHRPRREYFGYTTAIGVAAVAVVVAAVLLTGALSPSSARVPEPLGPVPSLGGAGGSGAPAASAAATSTGGGSATGPTQTGDWILIGAGDIARCNPNADNATAAAIESVIRKDPQRTVVFTAGDNAYEDGTAQELAACYGPTWGQFKAITHPTIGNHDYITANGQPYFNYFGAAAGAPGQGWYSFNVGAWHIVVLNSNCTIVDCTAGSPEETWLRADLAQSNARCTIAIWHHPRWSSSQHGSSKSTAAFYNDIYQAGVELLIVGHGHEYERFAPQDPNGNVDNQKGVREIMVGTGGTYLEPFAAIAANSLVRNDKTHGVLKLTLHPASYDWQFIPTDGTFTDSGSGTCH